MSPLCLELLLHHLATGVGSCDIKCSRRLREGQFSQRGFGQVNISPMPIVFLCKEMSCSETDWVAGYSSSACDSELCDLEQLI